MKLSEYAKVAKVGDRVRGGETLFCGKMLDGKSATVTKLGVDINEIWFDDCRHCIGESEEEIILLAPADPWDALKAGDALEDGNWRRNVLAIIDDLVFVSYGFGKNETEPDYGSEFFSKRKLMEDGWKIVGSSPSSPREVTMAEVVAKFGEDVVIKKE